MRTLFVLSNTLVFIPDYNKSKSQTNKVSYIPRFIPHEVSDLLLQFLVLFAPIQQLIINQCQVNGPGWKNFATTYLFSKDGNRQNEDWIVNKFSSIIRQYSANNLKLRFSDFHTIVSCLMEYHAHTMNFSEGREYFDGEVFHLQAGHTAKTGSIHYTKTNMSLRDVDGGLIDAMWFSSMEWWKIMDLPLSIIEFNDGLVVASDSVKTITKMPTIEAETQTASNETSPPKQSLKQRETNTIYKEEDFSTIDFKLIQQHLRNALGNEDATFRSRLQLDTIVKVAKRDRDIICVMPTGSGKSLSFLVPASMEPGMITVYISPLVALSLDMLHRCKNAKLSAIIWDVKCAVTMTPSIIIVTVEASQSIAFKNYLHVNERRLSRFVIDECHLVLTWNMFR